MSFTRPDMRQVNIHNLSSAIISARWFITVSSH